MAKILQCVACGRPLSKPLEGPALEPCEEDGQPYSPRGRWILSDGEFFPETDGAYILHVDDRRHLSDHRDFQRLLGCCGSDGTRGPNQVCGCGKEVATLKQDCWMPHGVIFESGAVRLVDEGEIPDPLEGQGRPTRGRALATALVLGMVVGGLVASVQTYLDWQLNPSGLFHGDEGTSWRIVWETWSSWFAPVALMTSGLVAPMVWWWLGRRGSP